MSRKRCLSVYSYNIPLIIIILGSSIGSYRVSYCSLSKLIFLN